MKVRVNTDNGERQGHDRYDGKFSWTIHTKDKRYHGSFWSKEKIRKSALT